MWTMPKRLGAAAIISLIVNGCWSTHYRMVSADNAILPEFSGCRFNLDLSQAQSNNVLGTTEFMVFPMIASDSCPNASGILLDSLELVSADKPIAENARVKVQYGGIPLLKLPEVKKWFYLDVPENAKRITCRMYVRLESPGQSGSFGVLDFELARQSETRFTMGTK